MKPGSKKLFAYLNTILFSAVLACLGILFFVLPHSGISVFEKRSLSPLPGFSLNNLFKGSYIDSLDLFFADNFPLRDQFVEVSFTLAERRGFRSEKTGFNKSVVVTDTIVSDESILESEIIDTVTLAMAIPSKEKVPGRSAKKTEPDKGLLIYDGMALQFFGGTDNSAKSHAAMVNDYNNILRGTTQVYSMVIPTISEFYLPEEYRNKSKSEGDNISEIYKNLDPGVISIDACAELHAHDSEYIYFNTDHHWTGLGAYYAYVAFCGKAGITPVPLDNMEKKVSKVFLGSLYSLSRDSRLKEKKDSVVFHKVQGNFQAYIFKGDNYNMADTSKLYHVNKDGSFNYLVYLGGDYPLMRVDTEVKNGRKILVIKNSYGNPFATYLVSHFEQVFIIDYRKYNGSVLKLIKDNKINDVIITTSVFAANSSWHIGRIRKILYGNEKKELIIPEKDSISDIMKDTIAALSVQMPL